MFFLSLAQKKCEQYWPETVNGIEEVGYNLSVTLTSLLPFTEYEIRTLTVKDVRMESTTVPYELKYFCKGSFFKPDLKKIYP